MGVRLLIPPPHLDVQSTPWNAIDTEASPHSFPMYGWQSGRLRRLVTPEEMHPALVRIQLHTPQPRLEHEPGSFNW